MYDFSPLPKLLTIFYQLVLIYQLTKHFEFQMSWQTSTSGAHSFQSGVLNLFSSLRGTFGILTQGTATKWLVQEEKPHREIRLKSRGGTLHRYGTGGKEGQRNSGRVVEGLFLLAILPVTPHGPVVSRYVYLLKNLLLKGRGKFEIRPSCIPQRNQLTGFLHGCTKLSECTKATSNTLILTTNAWKKISLI